MRGYKILNGNDGKSKGNENARAQILNDIICEYAEQNDSTLIFKIVGLTSSLDD